LRPEFRPPVGPWCAKPGPPWSPGPVGWPAGPLERQPAASPAGGGRSRGRCFFPAGPRPGTAPRCCWARPKNLSGFPPRGRPPDCGWEATSDRKRPAFRRLGPSAPPGARAASLGRPGLTAPVAGPAAPSPGPPMEARWVGFFSVRANARSGPPFAFGPKSRSREVLWPCHRPTYPNKRLLAAFAALVPPHSQKTESNRQVKAGESKPRDGFRRAPKADASGFCPAANCRFCWPTFRFPDPALFAVQPAKRSRAFHAGPRNLWIRPGPVQSPSLEGLPTQKGLISNQGRFSRGIGAWDHVATEFTPDSAADSVPRGPSALQRLWFGARFQPLFWRALAIPTPSPFQNIAHHGTTGDEKLHPSRGEQKRPPRCCHPVKWPFSASSRLGATHLLWRPTSFEPFALEAARWISAHHPSRLDANRALEWPRKGCRFSTAPWKRAVFGGKPPPFGSPLRQGPAIGKPERRLSQPTSA